MKYRKPFVFDYAVWARACEAQGLESQFEIATKSGVHPGSVANVIAGYRPPRAATREAIARTLDVSESDLWIPISEEQLERLRSEGREKEVTNVR